jgi:prepilin-type N-terminal cleavage/methylation domain-containing protein
MKTKGFTLIELVVACVLLLLLSTVSITTTYNFIDATANLKAQYNSIKNIKLLHTAVVNAKLNYATDLALIASGTFVTASGTQTTSTPQQIAQTGQDITAWNSFAQQNNNPQLINLLINPDPALPIPLVPLTSGSRSYLPTSQTVQVVDGNPVTTTPVVVQITDINSLLQAYQLTDTGTPTGNVIATISVGTILDRTSGMRPTLPIVDWKGGTLQEIQY